MRHQAACPWFYFHWKWRISLPATIVRGEKPGKTALITAGIHAGEYVGIQSAVELGRELKIEKMTGTVIIVKVVAKEEFENRHGSLCRATGENLNRLFQEKRRYYIRKTGVCSS